LYNRPPTHVDGHRHFHLCTNMLLDKVYPAGSAIRRNFSFFQGEKNVMNILYRRTVDKHLTKRYRIADYFFSIAARDRIGLAFSLAREANVELMVHPAVAREHEALESNEFRNGLASVSMGTHESLGKATFESAPGKVRSPRKWGNGAVHISVCICTYRRPILLREALAGLISQETDGAFTFSIIVVDNDEQKTAEQVVCDQMKD